MAFNFHRIGTAIDHAAPNFAPAELTTTAMRWLSPSNWLPSALAACVRVEASAGQVEKSQ